MIKDCFLCTRPIINGDCDKSGHDCSKCEYFKCEYCNYYDGKCKLKYNCTDNKKLNTYNYD